MLTMKKMKALFNPIGNIYQQDENKTFYVSDFHTNFHSFRQFIESLSCRRVFYFWNSPNLTIRDLETSVSWAEWYYNLQINLFKEHFKNNSSKKINAILLISKDGCEINVIFRLTTENVGGYTQYRFAILKVGDDKFYCLEP